jgi:CheY-like chemotaxis protein
MVTDEAQNNLFVQAVREALQHLYKPTELQKSPLGALCGVDAAHNPLALQDVLLQGIEALRPKAGTNPDAKSWRSYRAFRSRYSDQFSQAEVAKSLGLSPRQLLRQETEALYDLAAYLWKRYNLGEQTELVEATLGAELPDDNPAPVDGISRSQELAWLRESAPSELVAIGELVTEVLNTLHPVMDGVAVNVEAGVFSELPAGLARRLPLRQALISVLMMAARSAPGGRLCLDAHANSTELSLALRASPALPATGPITAAEGEVLAMADELVRVAGGRLVLDRPDSAWSFSARIALPVAERMPVLCVDDNADTLVLYQRALSDTRYIFRGIRDPQQVEALVREYHPAAIVMDIMLPGLDGWELLGRLRSHPATRYIPVIVCSILPEEALAMALGAAAFARKPLGRDALLALLDGITAG